MEKNHSHKREHIVCFRLANVLITHISFFFISVEPTVVIEGKLNKYKRSVNLSIFVEGLYGL